MKRIAARRWQLIGRPLRGERCVHPFPMAPGNPPPSRRSQADGPYRAHGLGRTMDARRFPLPMVEQVFLARNSALGEHRSSHGQQTCLPKVTGVREAIATAGATLRYLPPIRRL